MMIFKVIEDKYLVEVIRDHSIDDFDVRLLTRRSLVRKVKDVLRKVEYFCTSADIQ